jgi:alpha-tubulin suppressor-like RCC1 family protein
VVPGGLSFVALTVGNGHACGITTLGAAYCWGANFAGQLGDGSITDTSAPVAVRGGLIFSALSARGADTCGFASGGVAYCWGDNGAGQLGDGSTANRAVPVRVAGQP